MNETDIDIILAIAEGRLSGTSEQEALHHIAADPELGRELAAQMSTIEELQSIPPGVLTAAERTRLRQSLIEQLNLAPADVKAIPVKQRRAWWQPILGLATAAALVVAIVVVPSMLGDGEDGADVEAVAPLTTAQDQAADAPAEVTVTTSAAAGVASEGGDTMDVPEVPEADVESFLLRGDDATEGQETTVDSTITGSPSEDTDALDEAADSDTSNDQGVPAMASVNAGELNECLDTIASELPEGDLILQAATTTDTGHVVHLGFGSDTGVDYAVSVDLSRCSITAISP
jgi:anti-sigma factor RsiW